MKFEPFNYKSSEELLSKAMELGIDLPFDEDIQPLLNPGQVGSKQVPNRLAIHPMEGYDSNPDGTPGEWTFRRYRRYAEGGSGMIWFEATSVLPEARSNPHQMMIIPETLSEVKKLVDYTRRSAVEAMGSDHDPYLVLQLNHSGRYCRPEGKPIYQSVCPNPYFDSQGKTYRFYSDDEFDQLVEIFVHVAALTKEAGFDAVDIKACHGYLLHEILMGHNRENSRYGGSFENRTRFMLDVCREVQKTVPGIDIAVRLNVTDGIPYPYGFGVPEDGTTTPDLSEPNRLIELLIEAGCVLLNVTVGVPYVVPHVARPFDRPTRGGNTPPEHPIEGVCRFINLNAEVQQSFPELPTVATGYSWLRQYWPMVASVAVKEKTASFVGVGRSAFAYPDAPRDLIKTGKLDPHKVCISCSRCTELIRNLLPGGCVVRDRDIYRDVYRKIEA